MAWPTPAHSHGAKSYTIPVGYASITVRLQPTACIYIKPVPENRVSMNVLKDINLKRDGADGVSISFSKHGVKLASNIAKDLAERHAHEREELFSLLWQSHPRPENRVRPAG